MSRAEKIISFIRRHYAEAGKPPSVAVICKNTDLTSREFYESFGGVAEALIAAGVPVAEENIVATMKANEARRAGVAASQKGVGRHWNEILEVTINSPKQVPEHKEAESLSPVMVETMKESLLSGAIDSFNHAMEVSEREINSLKSDVYRRIAAGEHTEDYFLRHYRQMGFRGEGLEEVFREMLLGERARNKAFQMLILRHFPDLQDRFEQFTV